MRNLRKLTQALETMENLFELWDCVEPMMKSAVPQLINYMDNLERHGVLRTYAAMLEVRAKVAAHYDPEEIAAMSDSFVLMLSMLKKLSDPQMIDLMNRLLELPGPSTWTRPNPWDPWVCSAPWAARRPGRVWGWPCS